MTISTKSALVLRDLDILTELNKLNLVRSPFGDEMDHVLSRKLEPRGLTPAKRLETLRSLSEAGIPTRVMAAPMIPANNDMELERILDAAAAQGVKGAGWSRCACRAKFAIVPRMAAAAFSGPRPACARASSGPPATARLRFYLGQAHYR